MFPLVARQFRSSCASLTSPTTRPTCAGKRRASAPSSATASSTWTRTRERRPRGATRPSRRPAVSCSASSPPGSSTTCRCSREARCTGGRRARRSRRRRETTVSGGPQCGSYSYMPAETLTSINHTYILREQMWVSIIDVLIIKTSIVSIHLYTEARTHYIIMIMSSISAYCLMRAE